MGLSRSSSFVILIASVFLLTAADAPPPNDPVQTEFDRFVDLISGGSWPSGRVSTISAKSDASDEQLIAAAALQLNRNPAPLKEWHILKKEHIGPVEFQVLLRKKYPKQFSEQSLIPKAQSIYDLPLMPYRYWKWLLAGAPMSVSTGMRGETGKYLVAIIDSDQGRKVMGINEIYGGGTYWARMYNCDAVFTSPQEGGTPLIR